MEGKLVVYDTDRRLTAFISGSGRAERARASVVFIGGLTDGFMATPYLAHLQARVASSGWSLVQALLSSSYAGYGHSSLRQDVRELDALVHHLVSVERMSRIVLMGHSTGCQDIVMYMKEGVHRDKVQAAILQAPVSDREYAESLPLTGKLLAQAAEMIAQGREQELMPREADTAPITAYRYHSFASRLGDDDLFSSDFSAEEAQARLGHMSLPTLVYLSLSDEYVPATVDKDGLLALFSHMPGAIVRVDREANHNLSLPLGAGERFADEVVRFLAAHLTQTQSI